MLTNPNTLGLFEERSRDRRGSCTSAGGLVYCDGANMNAILGIGRPGDMGFDLMHFNLHKTFSTPARRRRPGRGPGRREGVPGSRSCPLPVVDRVGEQYRRDYDRPQSIGRVHGFAGNFGILVRA